MIAELVGPTVVVVISLLAMALFTVLANLLEQSGPIRLRSWSESAGPALRELYRNRRSFDAFRYLLRVLSGLSAAILLVSLLVSAITSPWGAPLRFALFGTALAIVLIELLSRHLAGGDPEAMLARSAGAYRGLRWILSPIIPLLALLLPHPRTADDDDTEEASPDEIDAFIDVGRREGILEPDEGELLRGLVDFGDTLVRSVMTPRVDLVAAPIDFTNEQLMDLVLETGHSRIPIYRGSIDEILGVLHVRDLLRVVRTGSGRMEDYLQTTHFIPETKSLSELLRELQERHQELAVVVDEHGGTEGVVTIEDLLEEIFGEIVDEHDEEEPLDVALADGSWRLDGRTHLETLASMAGFSLPEVSYETVGGLVFGVLGRVPVIGDFVDFFGFRFEVEEADLRSARRVRVHRIEDRIEDEAPAEDPEEGENSV
ncbi:MAG: hemolysin family protein [Thermoanaerobaculia bacterium]|nr:hemolysin family protein [Thermoanaerobaculia bacterium]